MGRRSYHIILLLACSVGGVLRAAEGEQLVLEPVDPIDNDPIDNDPRDLRDPHDPAQHGPFEPILPRQPNRPISNKLPIVVGPVTNLPRKQNPLSADPAQLPDQLPKGNPIDILPIFNGPAHVNVPVINEPLLSAATMNKTVTTLKGLSIKIEALRNTFQRDIFTAKMKVADLLTNGFYSENNVSEMEELLDRLAKEKSSLDSQLRDIHTQIEAIQKAYSTVVGGQIQVADQIQVLQKSYDDSVSILHSCVADALDLYEHLSYTLAVAQEDIINEDFFTTVGTRLKDKKPKNFFTIEKRGVLPTIENGIESMGATLKRTTEVVVAEQEEGNVLECLLLARKVGVVSERVTLLTEAASIYKDDLFGSPSFKETFKALEEQINDFKSDEDSSAECPYVAAQKNKVIKKFEELTLEVEEQERKTTSHGH